MTSLYEKVAQDFFDQRAAEDVSWVVLCHEVLQNLRKGFYPRDAVDALGQYFYAPTPAEALSFLRLWSYVQNGDLVAARIHLGCTPFPDKFIEENDRALQHACLCVDCEIAFWGGLEDDDGLVNLLQPISLTSMNTPQIEEYYGGPKTCSFPLEVGTQSWSKTLNRLHTAGLIARWPYHQEDLWLFKMRDDSFERIQSEVFGDLLASLS